MGPSSISGSGGPARSQSLFVRVAVLRNDGADARGVSRCEAPAHRGAIVEHLHGVAIQPQLPRELSNGLGELVEGVVILPARGGFGEAKARQVGRNDAVPIRKHRDEIAVHE